MSEHFSYKGSLILGHGFGKLVTVSCCMAHSRLMRRHLPPSQGATFHLEHIIPRSRGGLTQLDNLAWACPSGNLHKSNRIDIMEPNTGVLVPFFHPRADIWDAHFHWEGYHIVCVGHTPIGRATVAALELNHSRRLQICQAEKLFGLFPPLEVST
jgi:hypothetical protein